MDRRRFLLGSVAALVAPQTGEAQQAARVPQVGILRAGSPPAASIEAFRMALRDLGYVEGQTILVTLRPVGSGLVDSLARPGRNITGLTLVGIPPGCGGLRSLSTSTGPSPP